MERKACATSHSSINSLKAGLEKEWAEMSKEYVVKTRRACRPRLEAILAAEGRHIEK